MKPNDSNTEGSSRHLMRTGKRSRHNISSYDFKEILSKQDFRCAICKIELDLINYPRSNACVLDHDHTCCPTQDSCGKCIRGILCVKCNAGIGFMLDNPSILLSAAKYLLNGYADTAVSEISLEVANLSYTLSSPDFI